LVRAARRGPSVPVSWVLAAAIFALLLAVLAAWVMRAPTEPGAVPQVTERERAAESGVLPGTPVTPGQATLPPIHSGRSNLDKRVTAGGNAAQQRAAAARSLESAGSTAAATSSASTPDSGTPAPSGSDAPKVHQSIY